MMSTRIQARKTDGVKIDVVQGIDTPYIDIKFGEILFSNYVNREQEVMILLTESQIKELYEQLKKQIEKGNENG